MITMRDCGPRAATSLAVAGALAGCLAAAAGDAGAQTTERRLLGIANAGTNDDFLTSDILDRWRTGALTINLTWGPEITPGAPIAFGDVLEVRFRGEILAPEDIDNPQPDDRPYSTALSFGLHTHFRNSGTDYRLGADLVVTGPQTGLSSLQETLHEWQNLPDPSAAADEELSDAVHLTVSGEASRELALTGSIAARPFVAARVGDEIYARIGADFVGGSLNSGGLLVRDYATGALYEATRGTQTGFGWSLGVDVASVAYSAHLPTFAVDHEPTRTRARASVMWAFDRWSAFIGTSYLSEEFTEQDEGQIVGVFGLSTSF
ncbi:MAG: lipid A-modifier LpxR family protein [Pseudomonadota bacterium]